MRYNLKSKLAVSYAVLALVCVAIISIFANVFLEKNFREYVIKNQEVRNQEVVKMLEHQYGQDGKWNYDRVNSIGINALENALIIKVKDNSNKTIWDATLHNSGLCNQIIEQMAKTMNSRYGNWKGGYVENKYPVKSDFQTVGYVDIGYYGPFYFTNSDLEFINTLNKFLLGTAIFSLIISLILGAVMGSRISKPISRVTNAAQMISKGYYGERIIEKSNTKEIVQLTATINNLADTLEGQEKLRKRMASDVAHELRTPLATLQSHLEAMIDGIWEPSEDRLRSCHEEIIRINRMVGDLEKLAKIESENLILNKSEFDIVELTRSIVRNFESEFIKKCIEIEVQGEKSLITADRDKLSQVLVNLISNALKYSREGGEVTVNIINSEDAVRVKVKDNGIGIAKEDLPYIFERFYRADKSRNRLTGGAGIGLTITKAIVEAHRGSIEVKSKLNEGSEFIVTLPR